MYLPKRGKKKLEALSGEKRTLGLAVAGDSKGNERKLSSGGSIGVGARPPSSPNAGPSSPVTPTTKAASSPQPQVAHAHGKDKKAETPRHIGPMPKPENLKIGTYVSLAHTFLLRFFSSVNLHVFMSSRPHVLSNYWKRLVVVHLVLFTVDWIWIMDDLLPLNACL